MGLALAVRCPQHFADSLLEMGDGGGLDIYEGR